MTKLESLNSPLKTQGSAITSPSQPFTTEDDSFDSLFKGSSSPIKSPVQTATATTGDQSSYVATFMSPGGSKKDVNVYFPVKTPCTCPLPRCVKIREEARVKKREAALKEFAEFEVNPKFE